MHLDHSEECKESWAPFHRQTSGSLVGPSTGAASGQRKLPTQRRHAPDLPVGGAADRHAELHPQPRAEGRVRHAQPTDRASDGKRRRRVCGSDDLYESADDLRDEHDEELQPDLIRNEGKGNDVEHRVARNDRLGSLPEASVEAACGQYTAGKRPAPILDESRSPSPMMVRAGTSAKQKMRRVSSSASTRDLLAKKQRIDHDFDRPSPADQKPFHPVTPAPAEDEARDSDSDIVCYGSEDPRNAGRHPAASPSADRKPPIKGLLRATTEGSVDAYAMLLKAQPHIAEALAKERMSDLESLLERGITGRHIEKCMTRMGDKYNLSIPDLVIVEEHLLAALKRKDVKL